MTTNTAQAIERNTYRNRFPDVPDEYTWPTREADDATIAKAALKLNTDKAV